MNLPKSVAADLERVQARLDGAQERHAQVVEAVKVVFGPHTWAGSYDQAEQRLFDLLGIDWWTATGHRRT